MIEVSPKELYDFLSRRKFKYFFHANTVKTSCTLIEQKGLLSRGEITKRKLAMAAQSSDDIDKVFNVWNDIFFDIVDLHGYFSRQNLYGPVCFKISNEFLLDKDLPNICITKDNPIYWEQDMSNEEKYYLTVDEYAAEFDENMKNRTIQKKMFTIHDTSKRIPFKKYLVEVILDNTEVKVNGVSVFSIAKEALVSAIRKAGFDPNILKVRKCTNCYCGTNYMSQVSIAELEKLFMP